ncbi:MAG: lactate utilization protein B [Anaerolineales bacterium]
MDTFHQRIRQSLANETLQIALDANAERRVQGRINAFASLPDWKERRQQAHAIRADVIEHLDEYLDQFISNAQNNGITIHRAKDANEAINIFMNIVGADDGPSLLIAKSKSMVSEELDFNQVLDAKGMRVVETDLGEYIVQLRGEKPAHIITPAVHLRRPEVGQLFHEKLGEPYTEDIPTLVNVARKVLREVFLTADIGVSGANFGVAETGGICLVTNEGNGRMVTTLPPIHIALMGMERLVRSFDDLAIMLSLLPRSATGQKLSVYTQIIHKPLDGQQRHIIILDNGRTRLRNSPLKESLYCIRCGSCLNACPVFREIGGHAYVGKSGAASPYSGPIGSVISAGLFGSDFVPLAQASSLCGACKDACPVDIDLPKLLTRVRAGLSDTKEGKTLAPGASAGAKEQGLSSMGKHFLQIFGRVATHPSLFAVLQRFAALGTHLISPFSSMVRMPAVTGWGYSKDLPRFASKPFRARFKKLQVDSKVSRLSSEKRTAMSGDIAVQTNQTPSHDFITELTAVGGHVIPIESMS